MPNRDKKLAFVHIPKTGGTYVGKIISKFDIKYFGHVCVIDDEKKKPSIYPPGKGMARTTTYSETDKYYVFTVVRNIFDWLVSYAGHAGGWNPSYHDLNHYDYDNSNKGFDYLVKSIANRGDGIWPNRKMIFFQLFCDNGKLIADRILRTETLNADLSRLASDFNFTHEKESKQRVGGHNDYRTYYNDSLIEIVQNTWERDLKLFGYTFDGFTESGILFNETINKNKYCYDYKRDVLCQKCL